MTQVSVVAPDGGEVIQLGPIQMRILEDGRTTGHRLGVGRDERFARIDLQATAVAGLVLIVALIVAWLVATARGQSGSPYDWLLAVGGLAPSPTSPPALPAARNPCSRR
jgi:uncharacterized transporter YbjL